MIHEVEGDILLTRAAAIAHGVAANDPMKHGLALALHQQFPAMHKDFHHWCHTAHPTPGMTWLWVGMGAEHSTPVKIINLITQSGGYEGQGPGKAAVGDVNHCLRELALILAQEKVTSLALPRLATGVGGLEWSQVKPLIESHFADSSIPVYVYTVYRAGVQAAEPGV